VKLLAIADAFVLLLAVAAAVSGMPGAAAKLTLLGLLGPGLLFFGAMLVYGLSSRSAERGPRWIVLMVLSVGAVLSVGSLFAWLPFMPDGPTQVPTVVAVPLLLGVALFTAGAFAFLALGSVDQWRDGERRRGIFGLIFIAAMALVVVARVLHV